jgi:MFS family permease
LLGNLADRFGFRRTLIVVFGLKAAMVALPVISTSMIALFTSSFAVGVLTPGMVAIMSGRVVEIAGVEAHQRNWAMMTFLYSLLQAAGGHGMATLFAATHSFAALFWIGAAALSIATVLLAARA